jgi:hypothetical protein
VKPGQIRQKCKVRIVKEIEGVYPKYCPQVGKVYEGEYVDTSREYKMYPPVCIVTICGKRIVVRRNEFEIMRFE